ncbi:MAG: ribosomal protein L7/L12 [Lachnospiraceae bacterium]|nr:ribosomal protein L7/L12 [Lachnospiraceae bacterium]
MFEKLFGKKKEMIQQAASVVDEASLEKFAAMITPQDRERIISLAGEGRMIEAIQACREVTGAGLKEAKDLVENYQKYFK